MFKSQTKKKLLGPFLIILGIIFGYLESSLDSVAFGLLGLGFLAPGICLTILCYSVMLVDWFNRDGWR